MPTLELDFEVFCASCGAGLCGNCKEGKTPTRGMPYIQVDPCEKCSQRQYDEGYEKGVDDERDRARREGD